MKRLDKALFFGTILLIMGLVWIMISPNVTALEWTLLLIGTVLGILAGFTQRWAIVRQKRGHVGRGKRVLWIVGTVIVLIVIKVALNILFPTPLATSENGIWLSVVVAVGGLLLGHSFYVRLRRV